MNMKMLFTAVVMAVSASAMAEVDPGMKALYDDIVAKVPGIADGKGVIPANGKGCRDVRLALTGNQLIISGLDYKNNGFADANSVEAGTVEFIVNQKYEHVNVRHKTMGFSIPRPAFFKVYYDKGAVIDISNSIMGTFCNTYDVETAKKKFADQQAAALAAGQKGLDATKQATEDYVVKPAEATGAFFRDLWSKYAPK